MIPNLDVFGKVGILWWDSDTSLVNSRDKDGNPRPTLTLAEDGFDLFLGGGAQYRINNRFSVRGELELFQVDFRGAEGTDIMAITVDGIVHF